MAANDYLEWLNPPRAVSPVDEAQQPKMIDNAPKLAENGIELVVATVNAHSGVAAVNPICVVQEARGIGVVHFLCCYEADSSRILFNLDFSRMSFQTFVARGQLNVKWTSGDKSYHINFTDWSLNPGEFLRNLLSTCRVPWKPNPVQDQIYAKTGQKSPFGSSSFTADAVNSPPASTSGESKSSSTASEAETALELEFSFSDPTPTVPTVASNLGGLRDFTGTAEFEPLIELPPLVETEIGEEGEDVEFCERAKLYRYDYESCEWKERGLGDMKILRNQTTGNYRLVMRRERVLKVCANHRIVPGLKLMRRRKLTEYAWAAPDFTDGEQKNELFVARFRTEDRAEKFRLMFEQGAGTLQGPLQKSRNSRNLRPRKQMLPERVLESG